MPELKSNLQVWSLEEEFGENHSIEVNTVTTEISMYIPTEKEHSRKLIFKGTEKQLQKQMEIARLALKKIV